MIQDNVEVEQKFHHNVGKNTMSTSRKADGSKSPVCIRYRLIHFSLDLNRKTLYVYKEPKINKIRHKKY